MKKQLKTKNLAEQANRFMSDLMEDFISAPQPATTFDPFAPNYGDKQAPAKLPVDDAMKPMETDVTKDVDKPDTPDKDNKEKNGNKNLVKKIYTEMSMLMKDIIVKGKSIDEKLDNIVDGIDSAEDEKIVALDGINSQLYENMEKFNSVMKSVIDSINSVQIDDKIKERDDRESEDEPEVETDETETEE